MAMTYCPVYGYCYVAPVGSHGYDRICESIPHTLHLTESRRLYY